MNVEKEWRRCVISCFRRGVNDICIIFGFYVAGNGKFPSDLSAQPTGPIFKGLAVQKASPLKRGQIGCHETSTINHHSTLCKIPKVGRSQSRCCKINCVRILFSQRRNLFPVDSTKLTVFTLLGLLHPKNGSSKVL
jgi:hypothetical protein